MKTEAPLRVFLVPPTITRMFEPRHNILSNVRADMLCRGSNIQRESNRPVAGPMSLSLFTLIRAKLNARNCPDGILYMDGVWRPDIMN